MKKITALVLTVILALAVWGCQQAAPEQKAESQKETVASQQEPSSKTTVSSGSDRAYDSLFPQHEPYGTGVGAMPGRVICQNVEQTPAPSTFAASYRLLGIASSPASHKTT